ncbi:GNAT family N-acetyltransferase [Candidatus Poribacteria bacterium]|nr:GNAT family N-acetyltransferase [Candidatus Poribacteria bacterium]
MEIRAAHKKELEQVVELNCIAFNPNQHERYWQYVKNDSSYRLQQTRVVVINNRVVSTLRIWERRIRIGDSLVTMGGIGGVCTHPKYQGVGYASALMRQTTEYFKTEGYDLGILFTIIPKEFYEKFGWTSLPIEGFNLPIKPTDGNKKETAYEIRDFNLETDLDAVASIYDISNGRQSGTISRTRSYWDMEPSRIRGILPTVVAHQNGYPVGYLNYQIDEASVDIREVGYLRDHPDVIDTLKYHLLKVCEQQNIDTISGMFTPKHPFVERLIAEVNSEVNTTTNTNMMLYAVSLTTLLRRFVVDWESKIADSDESFPQLAVKFPIVNGQQAVVRYDGNDTVQIIEDDTDAIKLELSEEYFWRLLFGDIGWEHANISKSVSDEISRFLDLLFPKRDVIYWYPDRY